MRIALEPLVACRMFRNRGSVCIECLDISHMEKICTLIKFLEPPLAQLRIGKRIVVLVPDLKKRIFPIQITSNRDLMA